MLALQALCLFDAQGDNFRHQADEFLRDTVNQHDVGVKRAPPQDVLSFARALAFDAWSRREEYDRMLVKAAPDWPIHRMAPVDRNILRLGLHELLEHPETPPQVVINEAVDLARMFGDVDSPNFINGVLDAIRREAGIAAPEKASDAKRP